MRSKDVLGFLDEKEMGTNKACLQENVNTQSTGEKKKQRSWMRMVRKEAGGGVRPGGSRAPALPLTAGRPCPRAHCPAHLQTLSSDQEKCCHFTTAPEHGTLAHGRRSLISIFGSSNGWSDGWMMVRSGDQNSRGREEEDTPRAATNK